MKHLISLVISALLLGLAGCDSVGSKVRERFSAPVYHTKVVAADQHQAYEAARVALNGLGFKYVRGGPAQGTLEAIGPVLAPDGRGTARQRFLKARFSNHLEGGTEIAVLFTELVEDDFNRKPGEGSIMPLRDTPLYDAYFRYIEAELKAR